MLTALILGLSYGFTAGISPGPMLGLVITQTLQRGWRAGNIVACAPLLTDAPIILVATLLISQLPHAALNWLGLIGGAFVIYLGVETLRALRQPSSLAAATSSPVLASTENRATRAVLWRAITTNALNPHPYLFWGTVGAQLLVRNFASSGLLGAVILLSSFYLVLVSTKLLVAFFVNRSRHWLQGVAYQRILSGSGLLLIALGLWLAGEGLGSLLGLF